MYLGIQSKEGRTIPRLKKTEAQRRTERFAEHYRIGKARIGLQETHIAKGLEICEATLRNHKRNPDSFSFGQVITLGRMLGWTDEDWLSIIRAKQ